MNRQWMWLFFSLLVVEIMAACGDPIADGAISVELAVEAISPESVPSRGNVEVTILGKNFDEGTLVLVEGNEALGVVRHNDHRITFVAPALPVGAKDLQLQSGRQSLLVQEALTYFAEDLQFSRETLLSDLNEVAQFLVGDTDGDGLDDLVVMEYCGGVVASLVNRGAGRRLVRRAVIRDEDQAACRGLEMLADLNGDGLADLVDYRGIYFATGDGTFSTCMDLVDQGYAEDYILGATIGDFDGDGRNQLAIFVQEGEHQEPDRLEIWRQDEDATLVLETVRTDIQASVDTYDPNDLQAADIDRDGNADLIYLENGHLQVLLGPDFDREKGWSSVEDFTNSLSFQFEVRYMNDDGCLDVLVSVADWVWIYHGTGSGDFEEPIVVEGMCGPLGGDLMVPTRELSWSVTTPNLLVCRGGTVQVLVWYYGGPYHNGTLDREIGRRRQLALADLDGDPAVDIVYQGRDGLMALYGTSGLKGKFVGNWGLTLDGPPDYVWPWDLVVATQGHFAPGIHLAAASGPQVALVEWDGAGMRAVEQHDIDHCDFLPSPDCINFLYDYEVSHIQAGDLDGDGHDDLVVVIDRGTNLDDPPPDILLVLYVEGDSLRVGEVLEGKGDAYSDWQRLILDDLDGDGKCDIIWLKYWSTTPLSQAWLNREGVFEEVVLSHRDPIVKSRDLDVDGDVDLYSVTGIGYPQIHLWWNNGSGEFEEEIVRLDELTSDRPQLDLMDAEVIPNTDGTLTLWFLCEDQYSSPPVRVGRVTLDAERKIGEMETISMTLDSERLALRLGEANGDGIPDVFVFPGLPPHHYGGGWGTEMAVAISTADGGFLETVAFELVPPNWTKPQDWQWSALELIDMDRDGLDDIVYANNQEWAKLVMVRNESE